MFGKKIDKNLKLPDIKINKIPDDFYGGTNPIIKFKETAKKEEKPKAGLSILSQSDKKTFDQQTTVGAGQKLHPINLFANWKFLLLVGLIILVLGSLASGGYYYWQYRKALPTAPLISPPIVTTPVVTEPVVSPVPVVENIPAVITTPAVIGTEPKIDFPSGLLSTSVDTDKDAATDVAEELFKTDSANPDTDGDSYPDGHEIFYLYNPAGKEPMRLIDSGLVAVYSNPIFGYELYYPKDWAVGNIDSSYKDILFSTISGENIEVRVMTLAPGQIFNDWFAMYAPNEKISDYAPFESVFKQGGLARKDNLVYLFPHNNQVVVMVYRTTDSSIVNYEIVAKMMARSLQFGNSTEVPARTVEENMSNPSSTTTSTSTSSTSASTI